MQTMAAKLIRCAGLSAMAAGILFVFIQLIHPPEALASVTTTMWIVVHALSVTMCLLWLWGIVGIYAVQVERAGWLGLAGVLVWSVFLVLTAAFTFAEAFILPPLVNDAPDFVQGFLGISSGSGGGAANVGILPTLYSLSGVLYLLGGVAFGVATLRAGILPRWTGAVLAAGTLAPLVFSILPHDYIRLAAVPAGIGLVCLGYSVWSETRTTVSATVPVDVR
jgi:hypothetical protein